MPPPLLQASYRVLRFWLREIWGPDWDGPRRRLLLKHYRGFLRNGDIPTEYFPDPETGAAAVQEAFSKAYRRKLAEVQQDAPPARGVHLTYRPIGKNLRLLGTALREGVDRHRRVYIEPGGPAIEERALAARGHQWSPWLWVRNGSMPRGEAEEADAARAWNLLFRHPAPPEPGAVGKQSARQDGRIRLAGKDPRFPASRQRLEQVLKLAAATRYVFTPAEPVAERIRELKAAMGWPGENTPVLGVHVRRGDAASTEADPRQATRRSFGLASYLEAADRICARYGIGDLFLATESPEEIDRARRLRPQYRFFSLDYDRSLFPTIGSGRFIEDYTLDHPELARALATSAVLDLALFCDCRGFVGAFNSEFSVLAWLLVIGSRGHLVPYLSLSRPAPGRSLHPFHALLNLRTNCPLELYHW